MVRVLDSYRNDIWMNDNVVYMPKEIETMICGVCENNTFFICEDNFIHCSECHTLVSGIEWIQLNE